MALWQLINKDGVPHADQFDDGLAYMPGEDGWSTDGVTSRAAALGKDWTYSLIGVPNWHARIEAEQKAASDAEQAEKDAAEELAREAAAKDRIAELIDPAGFAKARAEAALRAEFAELIGFASDAEKTKLDEALTERLDAL